MAWEILSENIRIKAEKIKKKQGSITENQLNTCIVSEFNQLKNSGVVDYLFEGVDERTLQNWVSNIQTRLKSVIITTIGSDNTIGDSTEYDRWIEERSPSLVWNYFDRYVQYLRRIGRPSEVIQSTVRSTREIIERLGDPAKEIDQLQKGLVLGSVQSGKTANFNGVINRAIDAGYDIIIVFSGLMEDLRSQTQKRINNDVIGLGEIGGQINQAVGVGNIQQFGRNGVYQITSITSTTADFRKSLVDVNFDFSNQRILVCKKNVSVLTNLIYWLRSSMPQADTRLSRSVLIIDDEADNASLNNLGYKGAEYASKVNGNIRALLNLFKRRSYLGYTATPFANILQDQHGEVDSESAWKIKFRYNGVTRDLDLSLSPGLFPDRFIYKLSTPSSYLGPRRFFSNGMEQEGDKKIPLIETIPEPEKDEDFPVGDTGLSLKRSLIDAIDCFILSIALRDSRKSILESLPGYTNHHTMLVHISRLIVEQNEIANKIKRYVEIVEKRINDDSINDPHGIYERLRLQWNRYFAYKVANIRSYLPGDYNTDGLEPKTWDDISELLPNAVGNISVKAVNSQKGDKLDYSGPVNKKYIAVGGNRLSRGFTLEGLTINYFLRDTDYYDTLLQMGRWFGYRPGYIDACRLFIDFPTERKYNFITAALCELEGQIESMELQRKTPKEFELRIRKDPETLQITRNVILKNAKEVYFSYQDNVQQSTLFEIKKNTLESAWSGFKALTDKLDFVKSDEDPGFYILEGDKNLLYNFLDLPRSYRTGPGSFDINSIKEYVDLCVSRGKLTKWTIAIKHTGSGQWLKEGLKEGKYPVRMTVRSAPKKKEELKYYEMLLNEQLFIASGKSMNIMTSGSDEAVGLSKVNKGRAIGEFRNFKKEKFIKENEGATEEEAIAKTKDTTLPGWIFRKNRAESEGLLLIYLIDMKGIFNDDVLDIVAKEKQLNTEIPLIGYALSFPPINDDPGGVYLANETVTSTAEIDLEYGDTEVPEDLNTEINDIV
ncbi:Z1 domain-containing protein [Cytophagaceae bacterium YF14B1]|uniref:Z1 domain-containing protein n=1 Tax=Xanthocytophaga flava TaxID=3048013 RepID=A0AAE3U9E1_9BACT|nr:Z1 domain-containing protein [Xanthocytophaga flavus]MDJ1483587.1 Z1 domain-containing protein [Xanthocytophaga flavus]